jgi:4-carboxymuconolactone decarboxylase
MSRLPRPRPDDLTGPQRSVYDLIVGGDRASDSSFDLTDSEGRLHGPFNAMVLVPEIGGPLSQLGTALRFAGRLSAREREIAILAVAAAKKSSFELYAHRRVGRTIGLTDGEITALEAGGPGASFDEREVCVHELANHLLAERTVTDELFARLRATLSDPDLVEVSTIVGYYSTLALQLRLFDVTPPD